MARPAGPARKKRTEYGSDLDFNKKEKRALKYFFSAAAGQKQPRGRDAQEERVGWRHLVGDFMCGLRPVDGPVIDFNECGRPSQVKKEDRVLKQRFSQRQRQSTELIPISRKRRPSTQVTL